jgi:hypothetical protein
LEGVPLNISLTSSSNHQYLYLPALANDAFLTLDAGYTQEIYASSALADEGNLQNGTPFW